MNKINTTYLKLITEQIEDTPRQQIIAKLGECANLLRDISKIAQKYNLDNVHGSYSFQALDYGFDVDDIAEDFALEIKHLHNQENKLALGGNLTTK